MLIQSVTTSTLESPTPSTAHTQTIIANPVEAAKLEDDTVTLSSFNQVEATSEEVVNVEIGIISLPPP